MNLTTILLGLSFTFLCMSLIMHLYQIKLMSRVEVPIIKESVELSNTQMIEII